MKHAKKILAFVCALSMVAGLIAYTPQDASAAKKLKLSKTKATIDVGKTVTVKVKNGTKKTKVTWKINDKKIAKITNKTAKGKKAQAKVKGVKAGKATLTASYKSGKKTKKLSCKITVRGEAAADNNTTPSGNGGNNAVTPTTPADNGNPSAPTPVPTETPEPFNIVSDNAASVMMYIDKNDSEYDGISHAAAGFKADVHRSLNR